jgi:hypothetical protein
LSHEADFFWWQNSSREKLFVFHGQKQGSTGNTKQNGGIEPQETIVDPK